MRRIFACAECGTLTVAGRATSKYCSRHCLGLASGRRHARQTYMSPEKFWKRVGHQERQDRCWEWSGARQTDGYGSLRYQGKPMLAHRLAWILTHGDIADGLEVLHQCDNPPCVNPQHLYLGTQLENMRDRKERGRYASAYMPRVRWTYEDVAAMRDAYKKGASIKSIAKDYQSGTGHICDIVHGKAYANIPGAIPIQPGKRVVRA